MESRKVKKKFLKEEEMNDRNKKEEIEVIIMKGSE